jgi:hypothetical protein
LQLATRRSSIQSMRPSRRDSCSRHDGWASRHESRARRPAPTASPSPRRAAFGEDAASSASARARTCATPGGTCAAPAGTAQARGPVQRGPAVPPPPASAEDPAAPVVQERLKVRMRYDRPHVLVPQWCAGRAAGDVSGDTRPPHAGAAESLTKCEAAFVTFEQAIRTATALPAPPPGPPRRRRCRRPGSQSTQLSSAGATWRRRLGSWAGSCSTGGRTMAGCAALSPGGLGLCSRGAPVLRVSH